MVLLAMLPLCGPLVGAAFGLSPVALYLSSPVATASLSVGVGLAFLAWMVSRRIIDRALRPAAPGGAMRP
jgi:tight adherence protein B